VRLAIVVLHGGPDFDHTYLLPDMDRLSDSYRLIYYDQRIRRWRPRRGRHAGVRHRRPGQGEAGDPDAVAAYYRIHFKAALTRPEDYERLMALMRPSFTTSEAILKARQVEDRLMGRHLVPGRLSRNVDHSLPDWPLL
jgi:hypothetical protein